MYCIRVTETCIALCKSLWIKASAKITKCNVYNITISSWRIIAFIRLEMDDINKQAVEIMLYLVYIYFT